MPLQPPFRWQSRPALPLHLAALSAAAPRLRVPDSTSTGRSAPGKHSRSCFPRHLLRHAEGHQREPQSRTATSRPTHPSTPEMSFDTFKRVAGLLVGNSAIHRGLEVHGGDPMLLDDELYTACRGTTPRSRPRSTAKTVVHPMQTNPPFSTDRRHVTSRVLASRSAFSLYGRRRSTTATVMAGKVTSGPSSDSWRGSVVRLSRLGPCTSTITG